MKIHPHTPKRPTSANTQATGEAPRSGGPNDARKTGAPVAREPQPTIARAQVYERAFQAIRNTPVVDIERVESVRMQLTEGQYRVDDQRTAEGLIEHERALQG